MSEGLALHWRLIPQRYNLIGTECKTCGEKFFPSRNLCSKCRRKGRIEDYQFSGEGEVYSFSIVHAPPVGFEYLKPYIAAIIKLKEGPLLTAQIVDCRQDEVAIGKKVRMVFRKIVAEGAEGIIKYGYKFRLVD
ncbi:MAG: Zn-ribbon domain-containing OB-fold protein [Candidatus Altiarchaeota archaeon]|nr:Zn-ribbon domain-containing OB-fold protein [Candidatus Altiarchaeota archaeon]